MRKKIFRGLGRAFLGAVGLLLAGFLSWAPPALAAQVLHYRTYHPQTGEEFNRFDCAIGKNLSGGYQVHWTIEEAGSVTEEDYTLGERFDTLRFRIVNIGENTDLTGERRDNMLYLRGQFKGKKIENDFKLDERPFYYNPKIGLIDLVRSGKKQIRFWGFQNKELKVYPMKAINEGPDVISVAGKQVEAVRVYWTVDDFRSAFFKRTYWFRASDGMYVKQRSKGGMFRELTAEDAPATALPGFPQPSEE